VSAEKGWEVMLAADVWLDEPVVINAPSDQEGGIAAMMMANTHWDEIDWVRPPEGQRKIRVIGIREVPSGMGEAGFDPALAGGTVEHDDDDDGGDEGDDDDALEVTSTLCDFATMICERHRAGQEPTAEEWQALEELAEEVRQRVVGYDDGELAEDVEFIGEDAPDPTPPDTTGGGQ
jgi:hypothetical protein